MERSPSNSLVLSVDAYRDVNKSMLPSAVGQFSVAPLEVILLPAVSATHSKVVTSELVSIPLAVATILLVGEIHILDKKIQPNGRRDNFSQNQPYFNLLNHLTLQSKKISQLCRELSQTRNREKDFYLEKQKIEDKLSILNQSTIPKNFTSILKKEIGSSLGIMEKLSKSSDLFIDDNSGLAKEFSNTQSEIEKIFNSSDGEGPLEKIPINKRRVYQEVFGLIYECSANRLVAKSLVDKILARISGMN